jgi:hypothetical protein
LLCRVNRRVALIQEPIPVQLKIGLLQPLTRRQLIE